MSLILSLLAASSWLTSTSAMHGAGKLELHEWLAVIKVSTIWCVDKLRTRAISQSEKLFPVSFSVVDRITGPLQHEATPQLKDEQLHSIPIMFTGLPLPASSRDAARFHGTPGCTDNHRVWR